MENYGIIGWIVIGLLAGGVAKLLMPGRDPGGCIITILLGIAGALLAGFLGRAIGWYGPEDQGAGFVAAVVGAFLILLVYRLVLRRAGLTDTFTVQGTAMARGQTPARCRGL